MIKFFIKIFTIKDINWKVIKAEIDFNSQEYSIAIDQANKKSQYTMAASQSGSNRSSKVKYNMQLMGIIAEIACKKYLEKVIKENSFSNFWSVIRYDDIRTDEFKSPENEFDLKIEQISNKSENFTVESRSSITHDRSFQTGLEKYDIIGPYTSIAKKEEGYNSIYIRPLYEYINYHKKDYLQENFEHLLRKKEIVLYLVAGCTKSDLDAKGIIKSMGQGNSKYKVLPIIQSTDIIEFQNIILKLLEKQ